MEWTGFTKGIFSLRAVMQGLLEPQV
jgi:hypothetical protein